MNTSTQASDPGLLRCSKAKLRILEPGLFGGFNGLFETFRERFRPESSWRVNFKEHLILGDSRAAVVVSVKPLLVAAYTDEIDCVAMLSFPDDFVARYGLSKNSRLLTVNTYFSGRNYAEDLIPGPDEYSRYENFSPFIAEFLSDDLDRIARRKEEIEEHEWERAIKMGYDYLRLKPGVFRDGRPSRAKLVRRIS